MLLRTPHGQQHIPLSLFCKVCRALRSGVGVRGQEGLKAYCTTFFWTVICGQGGWWRAVGAAEHLAQLPALCRCRVHRDQEQVHGRSLSPPRHVHRHPQRPVELGVDPRATLGAGELGLPIRASWCLGHFPAPSVWGSSASPMGDRGSPCVQEFHPQALFPSQILQRLLVLASESLRALEEQLMDPLGSQDVKVIPRGPTRGLLGSGKADGRGAGHGGAPSCGLEAAPSSPAPVRRHVCMT